MKRMQNKVVLITGAGSGIGQQTALVFAQQASHIIMVDVNESGMEETAQMIANTAGSYETHVCDVSDRQAMESLANTVHQQHAAVDVLINNAGIASAGQFTETTLNTWDKILAVNLMGVVHGCHFFTPNMIAANNKGSIVNLASVAGYTAPKEMPIYSSSKFAVLGLTESLRAEMSEYNIHVAAICPGVINTPIVNNTVYESRDGNENKAKNNVVNFYKKRNYPPEKVANAIYDAVIKRKSFVPVSPEAWALYYGKRFAPSLLERLSRINMPF